MTGTRFLRLVPRLALAAAFAVCVLPAVAQAAPVQTSPAQTTPSQPSSSAPTSAQQAKPPAHNIFARQPPTPEELADSLMTHKRYQEAIAAYKNAIAATHDRQKLATLWNKLGIAYQMMFNLDQATDCYRKSLHYRPHNADVLNNLGTVYDAQKDYGGARSMYKKAIKINPHSALFYKNLGTNLFAVHKYKQGWKAYQAALAVDPRIFGQDTRPRVENPASLAQRGAMNYYMARGCVKAHMPQQAIEYLRRAIDEGFISPNKVAKDSEFASLHTLPEFKQLIAEQKNQH
ncbi:MAG TPA: tetratricopeptide repeat protein [Terracidiphilus sp.]|nr:tetratricopeptide repeat protein [Terracidiphilus sp.]